MLYGIDYRDYHTAIHGIIIFAKEKTAEEYLDTLKSVQDLYDCAKIPYEEYVGAVERVFEKAHAVIDEIDYREINPDMPKLYEGKNVRIINNFAVDIYWG